jgi:hypothetical protein
MPNESVVVEHYVPGRLRIRIPGLRGDLEAVAAFADQLIELPGVNGVRATARTGNVVILYDSDDDQSPSDAVLEALGVPRSALNRQVQTWEQPRAALVVQPPATAVGQWFQQLNERVDERTGGVDLRFLVPTMLFAMSVRQFAKNPVSPPWYNLLWYAFSTFRSLNAQRLGR